MLIGITHQIDGTPIIRVPKMVKVGIGVPRGPALYVRIQRSEDGSHDEWVFRGGKKGSDGKMAWGDSRERIPVKKSDGTSNRAAAEAKYWADIQTVAQTAYPSKLPYFTFTRPQIVDGVDQFIPDFEAIERFGPVPTSIDVVFMDDEPYSGEYAYWSTSELKCHGDGVNAMRTLAMAATPEEKVLADQAKARGDRFFPIVNGCATKGCPYYKATMKGDREVPAPCKASFDLKFQLIHDIRVGSTSYFHTSGRRSIEQLFSGIMQIKAFTQGRLRGVPVRLNLLPYKTKHNGQAATQFGVFIEFRAGNVEALKKNLLAAASQFSGEIQQRHKQIEAAAPVEAETEDVDDEVPYSASAIHGEFGSVEDDEEDGGETAEGAENPAAAASAATQEAVKESLKETPPGVKETPSVTAEQTQATTDALKEQLRAKAEEPKADAPATEAAKKKSLF